MSNTEIVGYIKQSFKLKNQGFYKPAIEMLYKALSIDGDNVEILAQLGHLYKLLDNYERAVGYVEKVLEIDPKHIDCLYLLEEIYSLQEFFNLSKNIAEKIYEIQPSAKNLAKKINILNKLNEFEEIKELESTNEELDDEVLYEFACAYYQNYDLDKTLELLEKSYERSFDQGYKNENIMLLLAKIYYDKNEFEKSKKIFKELEKIDSTAEVANYLGLFELNYQNFSRAVKYFAKAQSQDDRNAEYAYNLASAYFLDGWFDEALKYFNHAICLEPENIDYHYSLAYLYYQKKLYDKALFELKFINTIEQHHQPSNVLNALILSKNGDLAGAKKQLENVVKYSTEDDFAYSALSEVYKELNQIDLAIKTLKKAIELNPSSLTYLNNLAELEFGQGNLEEALKLAQKILEINENYLHANILTAKINLELKNFDEVFEAAQSIIELDSNCPEGYYYNALALFEQGDKDFALESMKKSISLDLNNAMLYVKMSEFHQDLGDFKMAYEWAKEACELDERNYKYKWLCAKLATALKKQDEALKHYSQSYRLGSFDNDLAQDYAKYLKSVGKEKQAEKILK